jgi:hypothetical protein
MNRELLRIASEKRTHLIFGPSFDGSMWETFYGKEFSEDDRQFYKKNIGVVPNCKSCWNSIRDPKDKNITKDKP